MFKTKNKTHLLDWTIIKLGQINCFENSVQKNAPIKFGQLTYIS